MNGGASCKPGWSDTGADEPGESCGIFAIFGKAPAMPPRPVQ